MNTKVLCALMLGVAAFAGAQRADYATADRIRTFDPMLVGGRVYPVWLSDSTRFYYVANGTGADRGTIYMVDPGAGTRQVLSDTAAIARERHKGPFWAVRSPDNRWDAFVWNHNVYVRAASLDDAGPPVAEPAAWSLPRTSCDAPMPAGARPRRDSVALPLGSDALTHDGGTLAGYGFFRFGMEVAQNDAERFRLAPGGLRWSPDSRKLVVHRDDLTGVRTYPLYSSTSNQPIDHSYYYAAPGDSFVPRFTFVVLDVQHRSATPVRVPPSGAVGSIGEARWGRSPDQLYVVHADRIPRRVTISRVDVATGVAYRILADSQPTFVEMPPDAWVASDDGAEIFAISERDGWGHIYRYHPDGTLVNQVDRGNYKVTTIVRVDDVNHIVYFTAVGKEPGIPYYAHFYRVHFDGSDLELLSPEPGNHTIRAVPKAPFFIDTYSEIQAPPVTVLRSSSGSVVMELARGDAAPLRAVGWTPAEPFTVKARDGVTDLWGILQKPSTFDPAKRYPIIARVYPGPQTGSVTDWVFKGPDNYIGTKVETSQGVRTANRITTGEGMNRSLAELGFIVMQLDALGSSPLRSKAFHDYFYGHVGDNGLPDYLAAIRQLAARYPFIDTTRVGVVGHSGGGYTAAGAMLHYPDFFKVGVAMSGNHDFRVYGWYWGEKYEGPLVKTASGDSYESDANYKYAANLKGKLLLTTGDMDCNNPPAETLRLVDALEKAGKDFDFIMLTDYGHQPPTYAIKRIWDYFVRNLARGTPPADYRMIPP